MIEYKDVTDRQLLDIFPQAKVCIPAKLREWRAARQDVLRDIDISLQWKEETDPENVDFWDFYYKETISARLAAIDRHIYRLVRLENLINGRSIKPSYITPDMIENAKSVPIESVVGVELKRAGRLLKACCPLHEERTPSFCVYPENTFHCFGCAKGGDVVALIQLQRGLAFPDAVHYLTGGAR